MTENITVLAIDVLAPILDIINPRSIISAIHNYHKQQETLEGCEKWETTSGRKSKLGQSAAQLLIKGRQAICKIAGNIELKTDIMTSTQHLLDHLQNLIRTYEKRIETDVSH